MSQIGIRAPVSILSLDGPCKWKLRKNVRGNCCRNGQNSNFGASMSAKRDLREP
jgi:hypothetical protein